MEHYRYDGCTCRDLFPSFATSAQAFPTCMMANHDATHAFYIHMETLFFFRDETRRDAKIKSSGQIGVRGMGSGWSTRYLTLYLCRSETKSTNQIDGLIDTI